MLEGLFLPDYDYRYISPNDIAEQHRLSLVLVGLFSLATKGSLVLMPSGSLSLVTVGREDRRGPTTTDVFLQYHLGYNINVLLSTCHVRTADEDAYGCDLSEACPRPPTL